MMFLCEYVKSEATNDGVFHLLYSDAVLAFHLKQSFDVDVRIDMLKSGFGATLQVSK